MFQSHEIILPNLKSLIDHNIEKVREANPL